MEKIRVENLYKIFGNEPKRGIQLLEQGKSKDQIMEETGLGVGVVNASFHADEGEIVVIMGLSGSGKSTLIRCVNRLIDPTAGKIFVDGEDITNLSLDELRQCRQKHFGMVFQNFALFPHRTVLKNTELGLEIQNIDPKKRTESAMKALEQVGLKGWENSYPDQLSGGMQQRVGLARALALDADIMLMDEAFSALDPLIRRDMQDELLTLQEEVQKTILFVSHDLDEALKLGDRIVLMKDGVIVQQGTAEDILNNPANDYVAKFVEDVDMSKVLTAENVMIKPLELSYYETDGPKTAIHRMNKAGSDYLFVRKDKKLKGVVTIEDAVRAKKKDEKDLHTIMKEDHTVVPLETPANELFNIINDKPYPIAVINDKGKLVGVVTKTSLFTGLADNIQEGDE
ncbi:MAG: glycine betaine/L-proline ABC transporter ATP-binding protein [Thermodesulfobacteriota bacterium]|nr:glycine betaine/L-proline ABC transporter ATP-binding protein [Thermodesulfobacteriota bacterium]